MKKQIILIFLTVAMASAQLQIVNKRYLADNSGNPVYLAGMSSWALFTAVSYTDAKRYIDTLVSNKINFVCTFLVSGTYVNVSGNSDFANFYNVLPFSGTQTFSSTPNEPYWAHIDSVLTYAQTKGVYVHLFPDYLGYDGQSSSVQGWGAQTGSCTAAQMKSYGQYVGNRYAGYTNILWSIGGDCDPTWVKAKMDSLAAGIKQYSSAPMSARDDESTSDLSTWTGNTKFTLNYAYVYGDGWTYRGHDGISGRTTWGVRAAAAYVGNTFPFIWAEGGYWNETSLGGGRTTTTQDYQHQMYMTTLWGGCGFIMGDCPLWSFGTHDNGMTPCVGKTWTSQLTGSQLTDVKYAAKLFRNRHWWAIIPDTNNVVLTGGDQGYASYATYLNYCGYTSDSTTIFVYNNGTNALSVTSLKLRNRGATHDSVYAWWYNTSTGAATWIGNQVRGSNSYTFPSYQNVLVLDAQTASFPAPGTDTTATVGGGIPTKRAPFVKR